MSALGHKRTLKRLHPMSALPPKADIIQHDRDVRFVPKADIDCRCRPPAKYETAINLKNAKVLGISVPRRFSPPPTR